MHARTHTRACACARTHTHVHTHTCTHTHVRTHLRMHPHECTHARTHAHVHAHTYKCMRARTHFQRYGESVSTARRAGDPDPDKAIIADTMKLLGNSGYGKTVTNIDRHRNVQYCTKAGTSSLINNKRFRQLEVVTDNAYEIEMSKGVVTNTLPLNIGFFVYQYVKIRMLQFYYDFVDRYVERHLFQYCEMDTDSAYIALAGESIDDLVVDRENYFRHRSNGYGPNVVMNIIKITSMHEYPDIRGQQPNLVASRVRCSTNARRGYSK